jgi:hypothetical protein
MYCIGGCDGDPEKRDEISVRIIAYTNADVIAISASPSNSIEK